MSDFKALQWLFLPARDPSPARTGAARRRRALLALALQGSAERLRIHCNPAIIELFLKKTSDCMFSVSKPSTILRRVLTRRRGRRGRRISPPGTNQTDGRFVRLG